MRMFPKYWIPLAVVALAGCSDRPNLPDGAPAPGTMRVVSVEPLERPVDTGNLINNGSFEEWWAGAPTPNGFLPPEGGGAKFKRVAGQTSNFYLKQSWTRGDNANQLSETFHTETTPVTSGQTYVLEVTAAAPPGRAIGISLWQEGEDGWGVVEENLLLMQPGQGTVKTYRETFIAKSTGTLALSADGAGATGDERSADWYSWRVEPWSAGA